jgi:hypothetical protein
LIRVNALSDIGLTMGRALSLNFEEFANAAQGGADLIDMASGASLMQHAPPETGDAHAN